MDQLHSIIAENLKRLRKERKLSLDKVAEMTEVSKSMLSQIERGESSPTVSTLWKIATGLHVSFTSLMEASHPETVVIRNEDLNPLVSDEGRFKLYPVFPFEEGMGFEMLFVEMEQHACSDSLPHEEGTEEFVSVYEGELLLHIGTQEYTLPAGSSIRFPGDQKHCYLNAASGITRFCNVIYYRHN